MPAAESCLAAASLDGRVYTIGGVDEAGDTVATVLSYAPTSGNWQTDAPLLDATDGDAAVANAGHIYVVGGEDEAGNVVATLEIYDARTNRWAQGRSMPTARWGPGVAWSGNHLYAIGGFDNDANPLSTVEAYDPATNTWQERAPMPSVGSHPAVGTLDDGRIIVAGGGPTFSETADVELYTPWSNTWQQLTPLPVPTIPTGAVVCNTFYVISGFVGGPTKDVTTSVWAAVVRKHPVVWPTSERFRSRVSRLLAPSRQYLAQVLGGWDGEGVNRLSRSFPAVALQRTRALNG